MVNGETGQETRGEAMGRKEHQMAATLLAWYEENRRDLPWRRTRDPYVVWISEVMLQQTRVDTVVPYFTRFLDRFPDVQSLAKAPLESVLKAWENLGYYSRARNLHRAARDILERHGGNLPSNREALLCLPGIGPYITGAILSMAFGKAEAAVDGNVRRIMARLYAVRKPLDTAATLRELDERAGALVPRDCAGDFNQALMDLGARICAPRAPRCEACPWKMECAAFREGCAQSLPVKRKKKPVPRRRAIAAVIRDEQGRLLIVKRVNRGLLGGLWKLPGGEVRSEDRPARGLERWVKEELGLHIRAGRNPLGSVDHAYSHFRLTLEAHACEWRGGRPEALGCEAWAWMALDERDRYPFSRADHKLLNTLAE